LTGAPANESKYTRVAEPAQADARRDIDPERREAPGGKRLIPDGAVDLLDKIAVDPEGLGDRSRSHHGASMHFLQSVLLWNSCESFACDFGTGAPHFSQTSSAAEVLAGAGGFTTRATAAAACSSAGGRYMTQVHFTLNNKEVQSIIEQSVKDEVSKNILTTVFNQLMENQRTEYIQADDYERSESRQSQRNGYYERDFTTRVGTLELKVPRTRDGEFAPTVFERYQRNEKALLASMLEMYVSGVSTRKVSKIVEELCGKSVSKSFVSSLTEQLDPMVKEWQNRSLSGTNYPYLMTDVLYIKVREDHRVLSKSCHIAIGITEGGDREIIGFMIQNEESDDTWSIFFDYLKERGLQGTELIISDAHKGLVSAIRRSFTNASWQRCQVHFLRNIFSSIPKKNSKPFREAVKSDL